ncbi:hypothetical protein Zmor_005842 [Zophobas morio]|uniref:Uncharacterized protein n=1 Tax=Zophobas morio TaxID=2755281 RepID=A0AA38MN01_9CUCU|nr:hypothetical protein Zmor_005842 [Zophobas morio]
MQELITNDFILHFRPPPTFWEAAADAILEQTSFSASVDKQESEIDNEISSTDNVIEFNEEGSPDTGEDNVAKTNNNEFLHNDAITKANEKGC